MADSNNKKIVIKKEYFDNIKTAIGSLNDFFSSNFTIKNFPTVDDEFQLDGTIANIFDWLDHVEPTWISDPAKIEQILDQLLDSDIVKNADSSTNIYNDLMDNNDTHYLDPINAFVGYKILQFISDNFTQFTTLVNGIYTFELFTKPSTLKDEIELFSSPIDVSELEQILGDVEFTIFESNKYVTGVFNNDQITLPDDLMLDTEITRIESLTDLDPSIEILIDDTVQEAAEVNYFEGYKPEHIKYNKSTDTFELSQQYKAIVDKAISALKECDPDTESLGDKFYSEFNSENAFGDFCAMNLNPRILNGIQTALPNAPSGSQDMVTKYTDSWASISDSNPGAKKYESYDLYSVFKTDKDGTIKFLEDFLKINLYNDKNCSITNNTLLNIFNIFDSRIYFDILYNLIPDDVKRDKYPTEDGFVKGERGRINTLSRTNNSYQKDPESALTQDNSDGSLMTSDTVSEYVSGCYHLYGNMTTTDIQNCKHYQSLLYREIDVIGDKIYNECLSGIMVDDYIGESYTEINNHLDGIYMEADVRSNRERLQSAVASLIDNMEQIVSLDSKHMWNANRMANSYKTSIGAFLYAPTGGLAQGSTTGHVDIKETYKMTKKAIKGKCGNFTSDQLAALKQLHEYAADLWETVKIFWASPQNAILNKRSGLFVNDKKQKRTEKMAEIARQVVALKPSLAFIQKDSFVNESWVIESPTKRIYQEVETGDIPNYMKNRIQLSDEKGETPQVSKKDVPTNTIDELTKSIESKLDADGDDIDDVLGTGYENNPHKGSGEKSVVINVTNNYTNSFNKDSNNSSTKNDLSSGKTANTTLTNSNNDSSTNKDASSRKQTNSVELNNNNSNNNTSPDNTGANNYNNSDSSQDTKDSPNIRHELDNSQTLSDGKTLQEMFMFLEAEEPLSNGNVAAGNPPKDDLLTTAMDRDRKTLPLQQKGKKALQKTKNIGKALISPIGRAKETLTKVVDSLIKRDEDKVKAEIVESPSYRSTLYKAARLAIKCGAIGLCFTINMYLGAAVLGVQGLKALDRPRLRREAMAEQKVEMKIIDDKIQKADSAGDYKAKWQLERLKGKMQGMYVDTMPTPVKDPGIVQ